MEPIFLARPWKRAGSPPAGGEVRIHATRLHLKSIRHLPRFMRWSNAVRRQVLHSDGALGVKLLARPWSNAYYTITFWQDEPSVRRFVASSPHREIMAQFPE